MEYVIETRELYKMYARATKPAVDDVSLSISKGEIFGLLGHNGAGKTTLVMMLTTLTKPTKGEGYICKHSIVTEPNSIRANIGYCPQKTSLDEELTVWENMMLYAQLSGLSGREAKVRVNQLLEEAGLTTKQNSLVKTLSGGMCRRLEVMGALIGQPQIIFLDEPTLGLDPVFRRELWQRIRKARDDGSTIFLTTHYMEEADELCNRVAIINSGKIEVLGNPQELKSEIGEVVHLRLLDTSQIELSLEHIKRIDSKAIVYNTPDGLDIFTFAGETLSTLLLSSLKTDNIKVKAITYSHATLDDVFLRYAGQRMFEEII